MKKTKNTLPKNDLLSLFLGDDYKEFDAKEFINQALWIAGILALASLLS